MTYQDGHKIICTARVHEATTLEWQVHNFQSLGLNWWTHVHSIATIPYGQIHTMRKNTDIMTFKQYLLSSHILMLNMDD